MMSRPVKFALAFAALLAASPTALAERPVATSSVVSYSDLDLSQPAGVKTLLQRISAASKKVCGQRPMSPRWGGFERYLACRDGAMRGAISRIENPAVQLAFEATTGAPEARLASR